MGSASQAKQKRVVADSDDLKEILFLKSYQKFCNDHNLPYKVIHCQILLSALAFFGERTTAVCLI